MGCRDEWRGNPLDDSQVSDLSTGMNHCAKIGRGKEEENVWGYAAF